MVKTPRLPPLKGEMSIVGWKEGVYFNGMGWWGKGGGVKGLMKLGDGEGKILIGERGEEWGGR